jgi:two-component system osmolarity sensor histidine kinase EnvZ
MPFRFRNILPKGLYWRTLLIIVAPAAILQLLITIIFLDEHWETFLSSPALRLRSRAAALRAMYSTDSSCGR